MDPTSAETPLRELITAKLTQRRLGTLDEYVNKHRGRGQGWRAIAGSLSAQTGYKVSHESLRRWYPEEGATNDA